MEAHSLPRTGRHFLPRSTRVLAAFGDERLVEQVRRGNEVAFEVIYDRHHRAILSFARHMLASVEEAEDAVQHTFISAYDALRADRREIKLKAWLFAIARNRCLSTLRARREQAAELEDLPTAGLSEEVQQRADLRELLGDMRQLPDDQRAALVLSEIGDLSHTEIGGIVGCDPVKVKSLVFQARSSLIESRNARAIPCAEIREQLATLRGGALRRRSLRRHLSACAGCAEFRDDLQRQRRAIAAVLPVIPSIGLKDSALAALGLGGGAGGAGAAVAGGGATASLMGSSGAAKFAAVVAAAGAVVGGGAAVSGESSQKAQAAAGQPPAQSQPDVRAVAVEASGPGDRHANTRRAKADGRRRAERAPGKRRSGRSGGEATSRGHARSPHSTPGKGGRRHPSAGNGSSGGNVMQPAPTAAPAPQEQPAGDTESHGGHEGTRGAPPVTPPVPTETDDEGEDGHGHGHGDWDDEDDDDQGDDDQGDDDHERPVVPTLPPPPIS
jgi:RNA polymerase sigma factor (sigma-70 family)